MLDGILEERQLPAELVPHVEKVKASIEELLKATSNQLDGPMDLEAPDLEWNTFVTFRGPVQDQGNTFHLTMDFNADTIGKTAIHYVSLDNARDNSRIHNDQKISLNVEVNAVKKGFHWARHSETRALVEQNSRSS